MLSNLTKIFLPLLAVALISKIVFLAAGDAANLSLLSANGLYGLLYGLRFDATTAAAVSAPIILFVLCSHYTRWHGEKLIKALMIVSALWIVGTTMSDAIYAEDARKHVTFELFTAQDAELELIRTAFVVYWNFLLLGLGVFVASVFAIKKIRFNKQKERKAHPLRFAGIAFVWLLLTVTAVRGGWMDAPQSPMSAYKIGDNDKAYVAWSAPYSITYYLANGSRKAASNITHPASQNLTDELQSQPDVPAQLANLKDANIIFVLLESWVSIDMQSYGSDINATPYFDQIRKSSLTSHSMYADGYRTVQGMFASMCSFPNPNGGIVPNTQLQNNHYYCLPQMLKDRGWDTRFVQGSGKGIVGAFAQTLGFTESYGKTDYRFDGFMNEWGYMDGDIYKFSLEHIDEMQAKKSDRPFFMMINTGTTHGTFLPDQDDYKFGRKNIPELRASILHHADQELHQFLEDLKGRLTKPTLIVLMSDHTAKIVEPNLAKNSIPFLMYATDGSVPAKHIDAAVSQRDIGATILDWMGGSAPWFTGQSMLQEHENYRTSFSDGSLFFWVNNRHLVTIDSLDGSLQRCYTIGENTIKLHKADCSEDWVQPLYQQGRDFNSLTQQLLFQGKTTDYRNLPSIFPES